MNSFTRTVTPLGMTESLIYEGNIYLKRYEKDESGYAGLDRSWEYEDLPDDLIKHSKTGIN